MNGTLLTVLHALAALGAVSSWTLGMYFWYLRNFTSKPGAKAQGAWTVRFFAMAVLCTVLAWALRKAMTEMSP